MSDPPKPDQKKEEKCSKCSLVIKGNVHEIQNSAQNTTTLYCEACLSKEIENGTFNIQDPEPEKMTVFGKAATKVDCYSKTTMGKICAGCDKNLDNDGRNYAIMYDDDSEETGWLLCPLCFRRFQEKEFPI
jgi:hypothetical protein